MGAVKVWVKVGLHGGLDQGWVGSQFVVFTVFCGTGYVLLVQKQDRLPLLADGLREQG